MSNIEEYFCGLPEDRREALTVIRELIKANIQPGFEEIMVLNMPGWVVPLSLYPAGYHCNPKLPLQFVSFASQKNYMVIYLSCLYQNESMMLAFREAWSKTGKRLDMGASCLRFKKLDDLNLDLSADVIQRVTVEQYIARYEQGLKLLKQKPRR